MLLITGADGRIGRLIVEELLRRAPDTPLAVTVEDRAAAADLAARGVDVRQADYHHLISVAAALDGVDRLLLMPTQTPSLRARVSEMRSVTLLAAEEGVEHIVYPGAGVTDGRDVPSFLAHERVFELIAATGVPRTLLRASVDAEVIAREVSGAVLSGELAAPADDARVAPVLGADVVSAVATVLLGDGHAGQTYDLTGRDVVGWEDLAELASERAGEPIGYRPIDDAEAESQLFAHGLSSPLVSATLDQYAAYRAGWSSAPTLDLERLSGRPARPTLDVIAGVLDAASGPFVPGPIRARRHRAAALSAALRDQRPTGRSDCPQRSWAIGDRAPGACG